MQEKYNLNQIKKCYNFFGHINQTEIRMIDPKGKSFPQSFFVDNEEYFVQTCKNYSGLMQIYIGINERVKDGTQGKDVIRINAIILDIDPIRENGFEKESATDEEVKKTEEVTDRIILDLKKDNITPIKISSGNGFQIGLKLDPIEINDNNRKEIENRLQRFQEEIIEKYSNEFVHIDKIGDLPRIIRVWGTQNIKGENTKDRPHRIAIAEDFNQNELVPCNKVLDNLDTEKNYSEENKDLVENPVNVVFLGKLPPCVDFLLNQYKNTNGEYWYRIVSYLSMFFYSLRIQEEQTLKIITEWNNRQPYHEKGEERELSQIISHNYKNGMRCPNCDKVRSSKQGYPFCGLANLKLCDGSCSSNCKSPIGIYKILNEEKGDKDSPEISTLDEIIKKGIPKIEWLVEGIIPRNGVVIFGGTAGDFKTWTAMNLSLSLSLGKKFLDFESEKCKVLYIDEENGKITFPNRVGKLLVGMGINPTKGDIDLKNVSVSTFQEITLDEDPTGKLEEIIAQSKPDIVIVDSLVRCMSGEEDKSKDVRKVFATIRAILKKQQITFILLHHTIKNSKKISAMNRLRGSGDFSAFADVVLMFTSLEKIKGVVLVEVAKNRLANRDQLNEFYFKVIDVISEKGEVNGLILERTILQPSQNAIQKCEGDLLDWITENNLEFLAWGKVLNAMIGCGHSKNSASTVLNNLCEKGLLKKTKRGLYSVMKNKITDSEVKLK